MMSTSLTFLMGISSPNVSGFDPEMSSLSCNISPEAVPQQRLRLHLNKDEVTPGLIGAIVRNKQNRFTRISKRW